MRRRFCWHTKCIRLRKCYQKLCAIYCTELMCTARRGHPLSLDLPPLFI